MHIFEPNRLVPTHSSIAHSFLYLTLAFVASLTVGCNQQPREDSGRVRASQAVQASATVGTAAAPPGSRRVPTIPYRSVLVPGQLDRTFGTAGVVTHHNAGGGNGADNGEAVTVDSQGRIVVAGFSTNSNGATVMTVWRFLSTGALDTTFNSVGFVTHDGGGGASASDQALASSIAIDASGRILVAGYGLVSNAWGMEIWRILPTGAFDTTFGPSANGMVRFSPPHSGGTSAVLTPTGNIRVTGFTWNDFNWDIALWRYDPNGSFGAGLGFINGNRSGGAVTDANAEDIAIDIAIDPSNRIVLTGYRTDANGNQDMCVIRYSDDGVPDSTFGTDGMITHNNAAGGNGDDVARAIAFTSTGKIVITGWSPRGASNANADMAIWRFNTNGTLDTSFNGKGFVAHNSAAGGNDTDWGRALVVDNRGRTVVAGQSANAAGNADMAVWRYLDNGTLDTSFAGRGWFVHAGAAGGTNGNDAARGIALDQNQRLVVVGRSTNANGNIDLAVWRIIP